MNDLLTTSPLLVSLGTVCFVLFVLTVYFWFLLGSREDQISQLEKTCQKMLHSFNEIDEQAKLIVKTDLELNRAQSELEKRLSGLTALQRTSRQISQALNEDDIFNKLKKSLFEDLGFSKALIVVNDTNQIPQLRASIEFEPSKTKKILTEFFIDATLRNIFSEGKTISSINTSPTIKERIIQIFETPHFILTPISSQTGSLGFVFVGNSHSSPSVTLGDEELIIILASQIGQSLENAQLFDKVFRSSQELEIKVKDRTKQLSAALTQVEEINKKKTEFLSAVSHELRTPLTSIKGYAAILMTGKIGNIPDSVKERLSKINTHSDNLVSLINNLLDITRIESGRVEMHFSLHKIKTILDNIVDLLTPQVSTKEIKLLINIPKEIPEIYIDLSHAERVFINLLSNAIKFTQKEGTILLSIEPSLENGFAIFKITDSGIGMSPADLEKLFTEFFRAENEINQTVKGTGLGLVLAKDIVQAHHGKISVTSALGAGTTFSFTLPTTKEAFETNKKPSTLT